MATTVHGYGVADLVMATMVGKDLGAIIMGTVGTTIGTMEAIMDMAIMLLGDITMVMDIIVMV